MKSLNLLISQNHLFLKTKLNQFAVIVLGLLLSCNSISALANEIDISTHTIQSLNSDAISDPGWLVQVGDKVDPREESRLLQENKSLSAEDYQKVIVPGNLTPQLPGSLQHTPESVWYRLVFELTNTAASNQNTSGAIALRLGEISDRDRTFLNGRLIGSTGIFNSQKAQAYDKLRIYEIPHNLLQDGPNVLHIQIQGYFPNELGIYRDRVAIGPASEIWQQYYLENASQVFALVIYATFALYFLLFFLRRRQDRKNLYFALFLFSLVIYSFLRTQFKYMYGWELYELKRIQTLALFATLPLFYQFIRTYYQLGPEKLARYWDRVALLVHTIPLVGAGIVLISPSTATWQSTLNNLVQPGWLLYGIGMLGILGREIIKRNRDAILMMVCILILIVALVLDVLGGRALLNLPPLLTYVFVLFVVSMALILVNRFVSLQDETVNLNQQLAKFNMASRRFVPFEFLNLLEKGSIVDVNLGDQVQKDMTVLFSDIRSFTSLSESMTPRENFDFINSYLRRMGPVIRQHDGFIDKYIGDAIMALFATAPDSAVASAIAMHQQLSTWNESRQKHGLMPIRIGVGIHIGKLMLGTIGENERMEGTVIADSVNLASRIEGLTKLYGTSVLISGETRKALKNPASFQLRMVDRVRVKGKTSVVELYELLDVLQPADMEIKIKQRPLFEQATQYYNEGKLEEAEKLFREVYRQAIDPAADILIRRCQSLKETGLPENWDGTTTLKMK